jgi:hypothetical protein
VDARVFYKESEQSGSFVFTMVFESIVDWLGWYQEWFYRFMVERPKTWARVMREMGWHAAAAEEQEEDASEESS